MRRLARTTVLTAALLLPLALATVVEAPSGADPAGTVQITPTTGGTVPGLLLPLAGSADAVVFQHHPSTVSDGGDLTVATASGDTVGLGAPPIEGNARFSIVGNVLTASGGNLHTVYWWNLVSHTRGTITLPSDELWQTGAPGGFVYRLAQRFFLKHIGGSTTDLGRPFVGEHPAAIADGTGLLTVVGTHARYETFARPGTFRPLVTGGHTLTCTTIASGYAACATRGHDALLLPLDGRVSRLMPVTGARAGFYSLALAGSSIVAFDFHGSVHSRTYATSTVAVTSGGHDSASVSAFGRAVTPDPSRHTLVAVTSATSTPSTVVGVQYELPMAMSLSLSPGQLVYGDDRRTGAVPPAASTTFRQPLATSATSVSLGTPSTISAGDLGDALASGTTTVYTSHAERDATTGETVETLVVRGPHRLRVIPGVLTTLRPAGAQLSGNRLLYQTTVDGTTVNRLYDVATDTISALPDAVSVLSGDYVGYATSNGAVQEKNLVTGVVTELAPAPSPPAPGDEYARTSVALDNGFLAWTWEFLIPGNDGNYTHDSYYRDLTTMGPAVKLDDILIGLSASGPIVFGPVGTGPSGYLLQQADGSQVELLYPASIPLPATPRLQGRTAAWIDRFGELKVAPVDITPAPPRSEGDVLAPAPANPDEVAFHPYAPYSEQLSSCSVAITSRGSTVATLPCNAAEMAFGVADAVWDGQVDGNTASAGEYGYAITAAGAGGPALDADGNAARVTGTFTIT